MDLIFTSRAIFLLCSLYFQNIEALTSKDYALLPPLFHQDNYDKCMLLEKEALYCSFEYNLQPLDTDNRFWKTIQEISQDPYCYKHDNVRHSICVPLTCSRWKSHENLTGDDLRAAVNKCYDEKFHEFNLKGTIRNLKCDTDQPRYPIDSLDYFVLVIFIIYMAIIVICTSCDIIARSKPPEKYKAFRNSKWGIIILSFSLKNNWIRLTTVHETPDVEYLKPLQGVRFYNTILVIMSHTVIAHSMMPVTNTKYIETMSHKVAASFITSGPLCTSTFFWLSATLLSYGLFSQFETKPLTNKMLLMAFMNRYIRLVPTFAVVLLFDVSWWRHMGDGPLWNNIIGKEFLRCRKNWWTNVLFLNTIVDRFNMCSPTFWYLALDSHYFVLVLVLVKYIKPREKRIWTILGSLFCINIVATFLNNYLNDFEAYLLPKAESVYEMKLIVDNPQWHGQMVSSIGNTCGPIIGVGFGYVLYKTRNKKLFQKNRLAWRILQYALSYIPALSLIIIPGWYILSQKPEHDAILASIIAAFGRPIFILSIIFAVFCCIHNNGGVTESVLRWQPAYILGRLAYCAYLVQLNVILSRAASLRYPVYISDLHIVYHLLADLASSYFCGLLLNLLIELPVSSLQKLLLPVRPERGEIKKKVN
ncbi:unnamed protein product [Phyllotreta striolata]|uniref:Acyltransferase 3 domain-containing protein n=1 Tax=Phyllotreta striolata TaxID=444603 RepID=A0A9N9TJ16_PHYSR|nr:unnamed protein product [Phyllotreta striolata]